MPRLIETLDIEKSITYARSIEFDLPNFRKILPKIWKLPGVQNQWRTQLGRHKWAQRAHVDALGEEVRELGLQPLVTLPVTTGDDDLMLAREVA